MLKIYDVKILHLTEPMGIDDMPYFSWKLSSDNNEVMQTSYAIKITEESDFDKVVWDTGKIFSDRNTFIEYTGKVLKPKTSYRVSVKVTDNQEEEACAETFFETGFLDSGWSGKWIRTMRRPKKRKKGFGRQVPAVWFRKSINLVGEPVRARLYATAHGIYEAYVNCERPDQRIFAPEHTVYDKYLCYQTYDVTSLLKKGENTVAFYVGDGWYHCPNTKPQLKKYDGCYAVLFQLEVTYQDGKQVVFSSDQNVLTAEGAVLSSDIFAGELFDGCRDFWGNDNVWVPVKIVDYGYTNLHGQMGTPVMATEEIAPVSITVNSAGEQIVDFGRNIAGRVRVKIDLEKGKELVLEHGEVLSKDGLFSNNVVASAGVGGGVDQKDIFISGGIPTVYEPHFTYHGFRFVKITGMKVKEEDIRALVLTTIKENLGTFRSSDDRLNQLYYNIRTSQSANMFSIPTDCPQREKAGWTGDMLVYGKTAMLNEDCTAFFSRWLQNMTCDQDKYGIIPMVTPNVGPYPMTGKIIALTSGTKGSGTSSGWGDAAVIVPYSMYQVTGDTRILRQQYETMKKWVNYIITRCKNGTPKKCTRDREIEQYLWDTGYHYGEWLIPSQSKNGLDMKNLKTIMSMSSCYTAPIFGWWSVDTFGKIASILDEENAINAISDRVDHNEQVYQKDAVYYREVAEKMKAAFVKGIIGKDGSMPFDLMGAYVLPIYFDLVPDEFKKTFADNLVKNVEEHGYTMDTGFLATPFLLDSLVKIGRSDIAKKLLWQSNSPSWLYEVDMGATSIWENCFGYDADGNPNDLSFNHYAFGCVADWIFRNTAGLDADTPGFKHLVIRPMLDDNLLFCERTYITEQGEAAVNWKRDGATFQLEVKVPCNSLATVVLPDGQTFEVGSGKYHWQCLLEM